MTISQELAKRIVTVRYDAIPAESVHWAKVSVLDTLAVALAGSTEEGVHIVERVAGSASTGPCVLFGSGRRVAPLDAALVNGTATHALDFDASSSTMTGHPSVHLFPALFALGEMLDASGKAFIAAYIAGFETQCRIARAIQPYHFDKGWFPSSTVGVFGAAAGCANLLGLSSEQTANALGVAANLASGLMVSAGTMSKPLAAGHSARNGLMAALLAQQGFTSPADALENRRGFLTVFNGEHVVAPAILERWGDPFDIGETAHNLKRHPCCGVLQSSIDVMTDLVAKHKLTPEKVESIDVALITTRTHHVDRPDPRSHIDAKFSAQYCVARVLLQGRLRFQDIEGTAYLDPTVRKIMPRVRPSTHPDTDPKAPRTSQGGVEITVHTTDGSRLSQKVFQPFGRIKGEPLPKEMLEAKFTDCATLQLKPAVAGRVLGLVRDVDQLASLREIGAAMHPIG
jgi:2-methylcitrate dehydratase PrpD